VGNFFEELAKKLGERWVALLLLPGALFVAAVAIGVRLGHAHALDWRALSAPVAWLTTAFGRQQGGMQVVLAAVVLLAAAGTGLVVQALAGVTRRLWLGLWPGPLAPLRRWRVHSRLRRWHARAAHRQALQTAHPRADRTPAQQAEIDAAADRTNQLAMALPGRPTWMGDRIHALERIALDRYELDLAFGWPRLWLVLPETTRAEINSAHAALAGAVATGTWAWPYLVLGFVWWPAFVVAAAVAVTGWARARTAVTDLSALSEAALDLHGRTLAVAMGVADEHSTGPLTVHEGRQITGLLRKGR
jgi:hypothetical protein